MDEILKWIGEIGIVPVVKLDSADRAAGLGRALLAGGIPVAEVTFRTAAARDSIAAMTAEVPGLLVGAGTVATVDQARAAAEAGARFVVTPGFNAAVVDFCLERGMPVMPGISGTEGIEKGIEKGLSVLKFFPAEPSGGVAMLDALAGPYASLRFVPTGGIDASNLANYARRPQVLAVGGSWMVRPEMIAAGDWTSIERLCREAVMALHGFGFAHLGVNGADEAAARKIVDLFSGFFGFAAKESASSIMVGESLEIMKSPFLGDKGHLAIRCNDVERALARFGGMGIDSKPETAKMDKGRIKAIYLDMDLGGFAVHLLRT